MPMHRLVIRASLAALALPLLGLLAGCLDKEKIATIPDAENQYFTPDGRLIVTGGDGAFEIKRNSTGYSAERIASEAGTCNHTGLAQIGDWLFTACQQRPGGLFGAVDNHLLAARLVAGQPLRFIEVDRPSPDPMDGLAIPNGLAVTPNGRLLVADLNVLSIAGVSRLTVDVSGARPRVVLFEKNWLTWQHGIYHPNGVRVLGRELFVSDISFVKRYQFDAAGDVPLHVPAPGGRTVKNEVLVYQGATVLDDIEPVCGGVAINDFAGGRLIYMAPGGLDGNGLPTYRLSAASGLQSLQQPSSVQVGRPPMFSGRDVLVTEKGVIGELSSDYGNKLTRVKVSVDLNDPAGCAALNSN
jgi:hypothetical protein